MVPHATAHTQRSSGHSSGQRDVRSFRASTGFRVSSGTTPWFRNGGPARHAASSVAFRVQAFWWCHAWCLVRGAGSCEVGLGFGHSPLLVGTHCRSLQLSLWGPMVPCLVRVADSCEVGLGFGHSPLPGVGCGFL